MTKARWIMVVVLALGALAGGPAWAKDKRSKKDKQIEQHLWLAEYFVLRARDYDGAVKEYEKVLRLDKTHTAAALALADVLVVQKKADKAIAVLARTAAKKKNEPALWKALARVRGASGDAAGATAAIQKALALSPRDAEAHFVLYEWLDRRYRDGDKAVAGELAAAATRYLTFVRPRAGLGVQRAERTLIEVGGDEIALLVFDARKAYDHAFTAAGIGEINGMMREARRGFEQCVARQPDREECHYYLGLVHGSVKASEAYDPAKARASFEKAAGYAPAWLALGRLHRADDRLKEARAALRRALELDPAMGDAHVELAVVAKLGGDDKAAVAALEKAIRIDRSAPAAGRALAELAKVRPEHPLVREGLMYGSLTGDVFSTEKFKGVVQLIEDQLGGVEADAPEKAVLEEIVAKLAAASESSSKFAFKVGVLKTGMVNAFALPDGSIYVTRGLFDMLKRRWPKRPIDARHDVLGHVMAHEVTHVIRRHTVQTLIYQEAIKDASRWSDPSILTHVTRIHEIEADREGIVMAFLAGFHPRGGIEFMEISGQEMEIPAHLDHPTFDERVAYLEEYWTNDVRYAFVSFGLGVKAMDRAGKLEATDVGKAAAAYQEAAEHFRRFRTTLRGSRDVLNNLGVAYAKLGVLAQADGSPLGRWQTRFSLERQSAIKYAGLARDEETAETRGGGGKARMAWQLREAISILKEARAVDPHYPRAGLNLAAAYLAAGKWTDASGVLDELGREKGVDASELANLRGVALAEQGKWDAALEQFGKAAAGGSARRAGSFNRARALAMAGKKVEARAAFGAYLKAWSTGPWAAAARQEMKQLK
jgi:predicted Zn-dependent protease